MNKIRGQKKITSKFKTNFRNRQTVSAAVIVIVAAVGAYLLASSHAASPYATGEAEAGALTSGACNVADSTASGNEAVNFDGSSCTSGSGGCALTFITEPTVKPAFCETFDKGDPTPGTRSGDLNGVLWGVSRATSDDNTSQGIFYGWPEVRLGATQDATSGTYPCGTITVATDPNDVRVCNGLMIEGINDSGYQPVLAAYPRQPFDFAGRTGVVEFDVSNNSQGEHAGWPAFAITDQPVPAPYSHAAGTSDNAQNSVGFEFFVTCDEGGCGKNEPNSFPANGCLTAAVYATINYQEVDEPTNVDGCVLPSKSLTSLNHVEVQVNATGIKIYASDPGQPNTTRLIADSEFTMPLSRGLIWLEDVHYNGDKFNTEQTNSFSWDSVAFDGPVLTRDLGFDVLDNNDPRDTAENGLPINNNGYQVTSSGTTFNFNLNSVEKATGALFELNYWPQGKQTFTYTVNGNKLTMPMPNVGTFVSQTIAMPVPVADLHDGANTVKLNVSDPSLDVANIDLILQGAGGTVKP